MNTNDTDLKIPEFSIERYKRNILIKESQRQILGLISQHCDRFKIQELKITYNPVNGLNDVFLYDINEIESVQKSLT